MKSENNQKLSLKEISESSGLVSKIIYTALMIAVYRFGVHIPVYGVDQEALKSRPKPEKMDVKNQYIFGIDFGRVRTLFWKSF